MQRAASVLAGGSRVQLSELRKLRGCPCVSQRAGSPVPGPLGLDSAFPRILVSQDWVELREAIRTTFSYFLLISLDAKGL